MRVRASPSRCRVCALPASEAELVTAGLLSGWSPRSLAARFEGVTRKDVVRHARHCVNQREED